MIAAVALPRSTIAAMRRAMDVLDAEIVRQELTDCDDDDVRELADAADGLREALRDAGETA